MKFIKPDIPFDREEQGYAPLFRKRFTLKKSIERAEVCFAGLGYGYLYLNGKEVSPDRLIAPVSDYTKTVWYTRYDVTALLQPGENIAAVCCGNGWLNEPFPTSWDYDAAPWRDLPKMALELTVNGETVLESDTGWKCTPFSATTFNQLRLGEYFDSRLYDENWNTLDFDDSGWVYAAADTTPMGTLRECRCEPLRECAEYPVKEIVRLGEHKYLLDFGQNLSGYLRLKVCQPAGEEIILRHSEEAKEGQLYIDAWLPPHYRENGDRVQVDRFICNGRPMEWSPQFTYHGFRYVEAEGLRDPHSVTAVFVHQDVKERAFFRCSDERLNQLFRIGQMATLSNLFYMPTDCPTREKLGWCNDAQSSMEQFFTDYEIERVMEKWLQDIKDAMREDGALPGIVPTSGWGYQWGNGPVSEGVLFEIPYRIWLHTGNAKPLIDCIPYFKRNLAYYKSIEAPNGTLPYGLNDWAAYTRNGRVSEEFINDLLWLKFYNILKLALELAGEDTAEWEERIAKQRRHIDRRYISRHGRCIIHMQAAVAMLIYFGFESDVLKAQLKQLVEEENFHHDCGMVGMRYLFPALNKCGLQEYAYRILTAEGRPSYMEWLKDGATTLHEYWSTEASKNHHMYSCFMPWLVGTVGGIDAIHQKAALQPYFFEDLDWAEAESKGVKLRWEKHKGTVTVQIRVPEGMEVTYKGAVLGVGQHTFEEVL
ncbi:MAG: family 78 glycoside hydrolase catalytic domain [Clostridia bacterium]|nr:family 78 glycoside hydrolase catalytic domain [Clostridia bacterium]